MSKSSSPSLRQSISFMTRCGIITTLLNAMKRMNHGKGHVPGGLSYQNTRFKSTIIPKNNHPIYKIQISFYNILANFGFTLSITDISLSRIFCNIPDYIGGMVMCEYIAIIT